MQGNMLSGHQGEESGPSLHACYQLNRDVFLWRKMHARDLPVLACGQSAALLQSASYCVLLLCALLVLALNSFLSSPHKVNAPSGLPNGAQ